MNHSKYIIFCYMFCSICFLKVNGQPLTKNNVQFENGKVVYWHNINSKKYLGTQKEAAISFLEENKDLFGIKSIQNDLDYYDDVISPAGKTIHFVHRINGVRVYNSDINVSVNNDNSVSMISNRFLNDVIVKNQSSVISLNQAIATIKQEVKDDKNIIIGKSDCEKVFYIDKNEAKISWEIKCRNRKTGDSWIFLIDANTGNILKKLNGGIHYITGQGKVFKPDPRSALNTSDLYDRNNSDYLGLQSAYKTVDLLSLDKDDEGIYYVRGKYAASFDLEEPNIEPIAETSEEFLYNRSQQGFEEVNIYYFIDNQRRYVGSLGFSPKWLNSDVMNYDAHGLDNDCNAEYKLGAKYMTFGDGGVDSGEDQDVIIHEYTHGLHDALMPGGLGGNLYDTFAFSEGISDYFAMSYRRTLSSYNANYISNWFLSEKSCGTEDRIIGLGETYPEQYNGITRNPEFLTHIAGIIWSASLLALENQQTIGRDVTSKLILTSLTYQNSSSKFPDQVSALLSADVNLYGGAHLKKIGEIIKPYGFFNNRQASEGIFAHQNRYISGEFTSEVNAPIAGVQWMNGDINFSSGSHTFPPGAIFFIESGKYITIAQSAQVTVSSGAKIINYNSPGTPANFHKTNSTGYIQLAWDANSSGEIDFDYYFIQRKTSDDPTWVNVATITNRATTTYTDNAFSVDPNSSLTIYYRIIAYNKSENYSSYSTIWFNGVSNQSKHGELVVDVDIPTHHSINQNYPNPFNPTTSIKYSLPVDEYVSIVFNNILGQEVSKMVTEYTRAGYHEYKFDASKLPSGIYFYTITAGKYHATRKMLLVK